MTTKLLLVQLPFLYVNVDDNLVTFVKSLVNCGPTSSRTNDVVEEEKEEEEGKVERKEM